MKRLKQKSWADGKGLPPKIRSYLSNKEYVSDIEKFIPIRVSQAYIESLERMVC